MPAEAFLRWFSGSQFGVSQNRKNMFTQDDRIFPFNRRYYDSKSYLFQITSLTAYVYWQTLHYVNVFIKQIALINK